jgi:YbbR domain-containing protein
VLESLQTFVREALTQNLRLKALALIITILIFALVRGGREATARLVVDVEVIPPPPTAERVLMTEVSDTVKLRVRGSPRVVQLVNDEEIPPVTLDLRDARDGPYTMERAIFILPPGLEVVSINPPSVNLRYEPRITTEVLISPLLTGQVAEGNHVNDPVKTIPAKISIAGPISLVREISTVETEPVLVDGLGPGVRTRRVNLEPPPRLCSYIGSNQINVVVEVESDFIERSFESVSVEVRDAELPSKAEPITVIIRGAPSIVEATRLQDLNAFVTLGEEGRAPGSYRREVQFSGTDESLKVRLVPAAVIVQVTRSITTAEGEAIPSLRTSLGRAPPPP